MMTEYERKTKEKIIGILIYYKWFFIRLYIIVF
jgi:hypothetical protein